MEVWTKLVATAENDEIDCKHYRDIEEYDNKIFVVCEKFGEIPYETCQNCPENEDVDEDSKPSYIY